MHYHDSNHPRNMSPEARVSAIASIMALGVLRLRRSLSASGKESGSESPESGDIGLEPREDSRLHVHNG